MAYPKTNEFFEQCINAFTFDEETGRFFETRTKNDFTWKEPAGSVTAVGLRLTVAKSYVMAHHVVWRMVHGEWPNYYIKHLNGDNLDNRPANIYAPLKAKQDKNNGGQFGMFLKSIGVNNKQLNLMKIERVREKLGDKAALEFAKDQGFIDTAEFKKRMGYLDK